MNTIETVPAKGGYVESNWSSPCKRRFRVQVNIGEDEDGGFCAYAAELPGVASQGDTEADAIRNFREAFQGAVASYLEHGESIPWSEAPVAPAHNELSRLVEIDVEEGEET